MSEILNYVYFNERGRIKKYMIADLFQGSKNVDKVYIFADFDVSGQECTIMFRRADGMLVGEVDALPEAEPKINPATETLMPCFSHLLGGDVLGAAGSLEMTVRFYEIFVDPVTGLPDDRVRATGMLTTTVYEAVPTYGAQSTVILNLNRKINTVAENLTTYIDEADGKFGAKLAVDGNDIVLQNEADMELSRVRVPTVILTEQPGDLIFLAPAILSLAPTENTSSCRSDHQVSVCTFMNGTKAARPGKSAIPKKRPIRCGRLRQTNCLKQDLTNRYQAARLTAHTTFRVSIGVTAFMTRLKSVICISAAYRNGVILF